MRLLLARGHRLAGHLRVVCHLAIISRLKDAAIVILEKGSQSFPASYAQALGDIHLSAGREDEALVAYETAQMEAQSLGAQGGLVDMKVNALSLRVAEESDEAIQ